MLPPLISTIEVPCDQKRAYDIFVNDMGTWWPLHQRSMSMKDGTTAKALQIEPTVGGKIIEVSAQEKTYLWGTFETLVPHSHISLNFHMGLPPENASLVEVDFKELQNQAGQVRTRVVLTQSRWEAFGDFAEMMRGGYGSGWVLIFEKGFAAACGADISDVQTRQCD